MTKSFLVTITTAAWLNLLSVSCKTSGPPPETRPSIFDSVIKKYIAGIDSNTTATNENEYDYLLLKNYLKKDTAYFIQFNRKLEEWDSITRLQNKFKASVRLEPLTSNIRNVAAAYRFHLTQSFVYYEVDITAYKKTDKATLHLLQYGTSSILPDGSIIIHKDTNKIIKSSEKEITKKQWDSLEYKINYANYWGMKSFDYAVGFDGSDWNLEAIERSPQIDDSTFNYKYKIHRVYRWSPHNTAYQEIGLYMLRLAGAENLLKY